MNPFVVVLFPPNVDGRIDERFCEVDILLKDDNRVEIEDRLPSSSSPMAQETKEFRAPPCFPKVPVVDDCRRIDMACCLCTITILLNQDQIKQKRLLDCVCNNLRW